MIGTLKALGIIKGTAAALLLTGATAFATTGALPDSASQTAVAAAAVGLATADDGAGNAYAPQAGQASRAGNAHPPQAEQAAHAAPGVQDADSAADVVAQIAANKARLLDSLNDTLSTLAGTNANQHAVDGIQGVVDNVQSGDTGLNKATEVVTSAPSVTTPVEHPTATQHPSRP